MRKPILCLVLSFPLCLNWACGSSGSDITGSAGGSDSTGASGSGDGLALGGGADSTAGGDDAGVVRGGSDSFDPGAGSGSAGAPATGTTACSNGKDDDGDGLIDGFDPECTGAADDDEGSFATGIPGDNRDPKWQDCFFDGNSGAGDDGCRYATGCLTGELDRSDKRCALTDACIEFCAPLTPNGCDCFGCCTVRTPDGDSVDIETSAACSLDELDDTDACPRCVKSDACGNTCGRCELCPGKTAADLPADCNPGTGGSGSGGSSGTGGSGNGAGTANGGGSGSGGSPSYSCDGGEPLCGPGLTSCPLGQYCAQGCCLQQPPK